MPNRSSVPVPAPRLKAKLSNRLKTREDSEHVQALIRVFIMGIIAAYCASDTGAQDPVATWGNRIAIGYFLASPIFVVWIILYPGASIMRRTLSMVLDFGSLSVVFGSEGERAAPLYLMYLWVALGNGFRFGVRALLVSMVVGTLGFAAAVAVSPFWRSVLPVSIGMGMTLVAIPGYAASLVRQLMAAKASAEEADRSKSRFLATVSHELRTPLHAIIGLSDLLGRSRLNSEQTEMVGTVRNSGRALLNMVEDVLDVSSIQAGRLATEEAEFDLYRSLADMIAIARPQAAGKQLDLAIAIDPLTPAVLRGDWRHLRQILLNLITNAVKFTESGTIAVTVTPVEAWSNHTRLRFTVTDTGIGIPEADQARIFETFVQTNGTAARQYGGVGLGLTIVRQLTDLMGGRVSVTSIQGEGSAFSVDIPFAHASHDHGADILQTVVLLSADLPLMDLLQGYGATTVLVTDDTMETFALPEGPVVALVDARPQGSVSATAAAALAHRLRASQASMVVIGDDESTAQDRPGDVGPDYVRPDYVSRVPSDAVEDQLPSALRIGFALATHREVADSLQNQGRSEAAITWDPPANLDAPRVLIIDDSPVNRMVTGRILQAAGYAAAAVDSADEALERLLEEQFDLLLLDLNMPGTSGTDFIKLYRVMRMGQDISPIVVFSADVTEETRAECQALGVSLFLPKPSEPAYMTQKLGEIVPVTRAPPIETPEPAAVTSITSHPRYRAAPDLGVIDRHALKTLASLDAGPGFFEELVGEFERDTEQLLEEMAGTVATRDLTAFWDCIHAMRSSAANVGAKQLYLACIDINAQGKISFRTSGADYHARLVHEFERFQRTVHRLISSQGKTGA